MGRRLTCALFSLNGSLTEPFCLGVAQLYCFFTPYFDAMWDASENTAIEFKSSCM